MKLYRRGGEVGATPVLPSDEVDRLASQSAEFSRSGGVLGTRSGLPDGTPGNKESIKNYIFMHFNTCNSNLSSGMSGFVVVGKINNRST